ncbi:rab-GTPase-TBC domain-containing protein [Usnea florida]
MTSSPSKNASHLSTSSTGPQLASPRSLGRLRQQKSAHQLSSNYAASNGPSLISQQRQLQQRNTSINQTTPTVPPPVPALPSPQKHTRARSNSDAVVSNPVNVGPSLKRFQVPKKPVDPKDELRALIRHGPKSDVPDALQNLRHWILVDGLEADNDGMSDLRIYIWLILLNSPPLSTDIYLDLIRRGPSPAYAKIRNDTHRTLMTNVLFQRRVRENSIIRLLNAVAWKLHDAKSDRSTDLGRPTNASNELGSPQLQHASPAIKHAKGASTATNDGSEAGDSEPGIYVQGMNVLCAPFLYTCRTEPQAFIAFYYFITRECPGYIRGAMDGVHKGVALVERCLTVADARLSAHLTSKGVNAQVYAFASVLTMSACTPPLPEVLLLWDFLFSYGSHLNILCICSQLMMMREELLADPSPGKLLRSFPPLQAKEIIALTVNLVRKIPSDLYEELVHHAE